MAQCNRPEEGSLVDSRSAAAAGVGDTRNALCSQAMDLHRELRPFAPDRGRATDRTSEVLTRGQSELQGLFALSQHLTSPWSPARSDTVSRSDVQALHRQWSTGRPSEQLYAPGLNEVLKNWDRLTHGKQQIGLNDIGARSERLGNSMITLALSSSRPGDVERATVQGLMYNKISDDHSAQRWSEQMNDQLRKQGSRLTVSLGERAAADPKALNMFAAGNHHDRLLFVRDADGKVRWTLPIRQLKG